jgi:hypothetical protein
MPRKVEFRKHLPRPETIACGVFGAEALEVWAVIRALIILECVLLMIVALDRVVGVAPSGSTIERAARERASGTDTQVASMRAAVVAPVAPRSDVPHLLTPKETAHPGPAIMAAEPSVVSAISERPVPTAAPHADARSPQLVDYSGSSPPPSQR